MIWPGSAAVDARPKWVVAAEVVETGRRYLRTVARINPNWIEPLAQHLVERTYSEPFWDQVAGSPMIFERVTLFGLAIVPRRPVHWGPIEPAAAREMFILTGLVRGGYTTRAKFLGQNADLVKELERLGRKSRRQDFMRGEDARYGFYDQRIPCRMSCDGASFERWRRVVEREQPRLLCMSEEDLVVPGTEVVDGAAYPDAITVRQMRLPLDYRYSPGAQQDGITITVPQEGFHQLDSNRLEWLVPGLVEEKVVALIKSLPKPIRRNFVPVPDAAKRVLADLRFGEGCLAAAVAHALTRLAGQQIRVDAFRSDHVPEHLRMRIRIADSAGRTVAEGRDLGEIRRKLLDAAAWDISS